MKTAAGWMPRIGKVLPERPSLEHLRKEAKRRLGELRDCDPTAQLADAQCHVAREYGFESWRQLKAHIDQHGVALINGVSGMDLLDGVWDGLLETGVGYRLAIHLKTIAHRTSATLDSPDWSGLGIPLRSASRDGPRVLFELEYATIKGSLRDHGETIAGIYSRDGATIPISLVRRVGAEALARRDGRRFSSVLTARFGDPVPGGMGTILFVSPRQR